MYCYTCTSTNYVVGVLYLSSMKWISSVTICISWNNMHSSYFAKWCIMIAQCLHVSVLVLVFVNTLNSSSHIHTWYVGTCSEVLIFVKLGIGATLVLICLYPKWYSWLYDSFIYLELYRVHVSVNLSFSVILTMANVCNCRGKPPCSWKVEGGCAPLPPGSFSPISS